MEVSTMQARLETRRFPAAAVAVIFAILAVFLISALPGQQTGGTTSFDTCTQLVHKVC
jgi:hypothetical protein